MTIRKMIELVEYTKEGNRRSSYKYVYDAAGNNTELGILREDGTMGKNIMDPDAKGNVTANSIETPGYATSIGVMPTTARKPLKKPGLTAICR